MRTWSWRGSAGERQRSAVEASPFFVVVIDDAQVKAVWQVFAALRRCGVGGNRRARAERLLKHSVITPPPTLVSIATGASIVEDAFVTVVMNVPRVGRLTLPNLVGLRSLHAQDDGEEVSFDGVSELCQLLGQCAQLPWCRR